MAVETKVITVGSANDLGKLEKMVNEYLKEKDKQEYLLDANVSFQFYGVYLAALIVTKTESKVKRKRERKIDERLSAQQLSVKVQIQNIEQARSQLSGLGQSATKTGQEITNAAQL